MTGKSIAHIGLIEDDVEQARFFSALLQVQNFDATHMSSITDFFRQRENFDLLIIDLNLPDGNGLDLVKKLRTDGYHKPLLVLTAENEERMVAQALDAGADDYVVKPPRAVELMARVRALLRRRLVVAEASKPLESTAPYQFDAARREVRVADLVVHLTAREFDLIAHLFRHAGLLVARRELETEALRVSPRVQTRTLDTHISRLRRKLVLDGTHGWKLEGVYQRGYRLMNVREDG